jgi:hypothetical protein
MGATYVNLPKQSWEGIPDSIDFVDRLASGDTLTAKIVTGYNLATGEVDATIVSGDSISGTRVLFTYKGGTNGGTYKITFQVTSTGGAKLEEDFIFSVRDV